MFNVYLPPKMYNDTNIIMFYIEKQGRNVHRYAVRGKRIEIEHSKYLFTTYILLKH